ncbi:MAG: TRAP transporter large permease [Deferrisomatales bacterium]
MEWWFVLSAIGGLFILLLGAGMPVFVAFTVVDVLFIYAIWGGATGLGQLTYSVFSSVSTFVLLPVPFFVLMGEILFHSGVFINALDTLDKWMGRLPGRLCVLSVAGGTVFSTLSGSSMGTSAMLGSLLLPDMERRGYHKTLAIGSCMSGALAMIIPPSALAVVLGSLAQISIGKMLIAGIIPGFLMAALYVTYIVGRCALQPRLAPDYAPAPVTWATKFRSLAVNVLPFGAIIFVVTGLIFAGLATPTESAALGVVATTLVVACYRKLSWGVLRKSIDSTLRISVMMFMILTGSTAFSQILAFTGASRGLVEFVLGFELPGMLLIVVMQGLMIVLGAFMEPVSIMMITLPIFMPIVKATGFDPVWFGLLTLINMEIGMKTPPFGLCLFVMKGVARPGTTMADIYRSAAPYVALDLLAMLIIMWFPGIALLLTRFV